MCSDSAYTPKAAPSSVMLPPSPPYLAELGATCKVRMSFSIFFDGTRNNREVDMNDGSGAFSNVVRLYEAHDFDEFSGVHRLYVPGVGTPFKGIGEVPPHEDGASKGAMGAERIRYAFAYIANRIAEKLGCPLFIPETVSSMRSAVENKNLLGPLADQLSRLIAASKNPRIEEFVFDVFGFSRGAAAARSFVSQLNYYFGGYTREGNGRFCQVPMRIRFMGLFDTVASVGFADSVPIFGVEGHQSWGDEDLLVLPGNVEQCVHIVAAHEARNSFPVDLIRKRDGRYGPHCIEIVYPGMHSNVGGGYGNRSQGKGTPLGNGVRQEFGDKVSQVALFDMYRRARTAGVPLLDKAGLQDRRIDDYFELSSEMTSALDAYATLMQPAVAGKPAEQHLLAHHQQYLGWRKQVLAAEAFQQQSFVRQAATQDRIDLVAANEEFRRQVQVLETTTYAEDLRRWETIGWEQKKPKPKMPLGYEFLNDWKLAPAITAQTARFFTDYIHDSRAHFLLTDPQGEDDHVAIHQRLESVDQEYRQRLQDYEDHVTDYYVRGELSGYTATSQPRKPDDPLSATERRYLGIYRGGGKPVYDDANPASRADALRNIVDLVEWLYNSRREPNWTYLHKRQVFAYTRVRY